ncbi:hypothetical protein BDZ94DRAFT_125974 [Collybia nuda]|uniref:Uncharacterized protein n=1 Tax=Collybia nuda TaxID=64659 RepID=A0A9P5YD75_9AGAR|nr:hypothetical protein BDZ94DRAFT_125974 [Collybia nuda]
MIITLTGGCQLWVDSVEHIGWSESIIVINAPNAWVYFFHILAINKHHCVVIYRQASLIGSFWPLSPLSLPILVGISRRAIMILMTTTLVRCHTRNKTLLGTCWYFYPSTLPWFTGWFD